VEHVKEERGEGVISMAMAVFRNHALAVRVS